MSESEREAHYLDPKNASIKATFAGARRIDIAKGENVYAAAIDRVFEPGRYNYRSYFARPFGVSLNHSTNPDSRMSAWLNVAYIPNLESKELDSVTVEVIDPRQILVGKTALIDTIHMTEDDSIHFGSRKYPSILDRVDHDNVEVSFSGRVLGVGLRGESKRFGTTLYTFGEVHDFRYERNSSSREKPKESRSTSDILIDRYIKRYPSLDKDTINDTISACVRITVEVTDPKKAKRRFEQEFHPDRNQNLDAKVGHERYLLGQSILRIIYKNSSVFAEWASRQDREPPEVHAQAGL